MKISAKGLQLIEKHEGCILASYICPAGKWTVGVGHTRTAKQGMAITKAQAYDLLKIDVMVAEATVNSCMFAFNQNQFDALVCLVFNIGSGAFKGSTLLKKIKGYSGKDEIVHEWSEWNHIGKKEIKGLTNRRKDEILLYFS